MQLSKCILLDVECFHDERGCLTVLEGNSKSVPFEIKRNYILSNVVQGASRGNHGHIKLQQVIVCLQGTVEVELYDGFSSSVIKLDTPSKGLFVGPMMWRKLSNFALNTVVLVLASEPYSKEDYIFDKDKFTDLARSSV